MKNFYACFLTFLIILLLAAFNGYGQQNPPKDLHILGEVVDKSGKLVVKDGFVVIDGVRRDVKSGKFGMELKQYPPKNVKLGMSKHHQKRHYFVTEKDKIKIKIEVEDAQTLTGYLYKKDNAGKIINLPFVQVILPEIPDTAYTDSKGKFIITIPAGNEFKFQNLSKITVDNKTILSPNFEFRDQYESVSINCTPPEPPKEEKIVGVIKVVLENGNILPQLNVVVDGQNYTTDAEGFVKNMEMIPTEKSTIIVNGYQIVNKKYNNKTLEITVSKKTNEIVALKPEEETAKVRSYREEISTATRSLEQNKRVLLAQSEQLRGEIKDIASRLTKDGTLSPAQRDNLNEYLAGLVQKLQETETAYRQEQEKSHGLLVELSANLDSSRRTIEQIKGEKAKLQQEKDTEAKEFQRKLFITFGFMIVLAILAIIFFLLMRKLKKQKEELAEKIEQINLQNKQIEQQNREIELKNIHLQELDREKNSLMDVVAHDLKAPLGKLSTLAQTLPVLGPINDEQKEFVDMMKKVANDGKRFIDELLDAKAIESQKTSEMKWVEIELNSFFAECLMGHTEQAERKNIKLSLKSQLPENKDNVVVDKSYLSRIIDNLVSNAIKFSPENRNVFININEIDKNYQISIKDEGQGISEADQKKLFRKFEKLTARPTGGESSTGLGLSIVKTLVERLKGSIDVKSEVGKGTTFTVQLPKEPQ